MQYKKNLVHNKCSSAQEFSAECQCEDKSKTEFTLVESKRICAGSELTKTIFWHLNKAFFSVQTKISWQQLWTTWATLKRGASLFSKSIERKVQLPSTVSKSPAVSVQLLLWAFFAHPICKCIFANTHLNLAAFRLNHKINQMLLRKSKVRWNYCTHTQTLRDVWVTRVRGRLRQFDVED